MKFAALLRFLIPILTVVTLRAGDPYHHTFDVKSGTVSCVFNLEVVGQEPLRSVKFARISPGTFTPKRNGITAPIVAGAFQTYDAKTELIASGGFKLINGNNSDFYASLVDFVFTVPNDGSPASVSATLTNRSLYVGRIVLAKVDRADLNIHTPVLLPANRRLFLSGVPLRLTTEAAALLNSAVGLADAYNDTDVIASLNLNFKLGRLL